MGGIIKIVERVYCGVRFALMLDRRHLSPSGYPVCVRITHNYRQRYLLHGDRMSEEEFAKTAKVGKGQQYERRKEYERFFDSVFNSAKGLIDSGDFNITSFRASGKNRHEETINGLYQERIDRLNSDGKVNTSELYGTVLRRIDDVFGTVPACNVDADFVVKFAKSISELSRTTQSIYLRNLRAVCNYAIYKGAMKRSQYPFSSNRYDSNCMRIPAGSSRTDRFLSVDDMRKLYGYDGEYNIEVNLFLFSYLANGINLVDMARLGFNLHYRRSGCKELSYIRQKTRDTSSREIVIFIPVTEWLAEVMRRLGVVETKNGLLFPWILQGCGTLKQQATRLDDWSKRIRKGLQQACREFGIDGDVTMTWARHSFKTNLIRQKVPDWYCEQAMGHSDRSVGAHYVGMFTEEDRYRYNMMLL